MAIARGASRVRGTSVVSPRTTRARSIELPAGTAGRLAGEGVGGSEILLLPWQVLADGSGKSGAWTVAPVRAPGSAGRSSQEPAADAWSRVTSLRRTCMHHQRRPQARSSVSCMPYGCWSSLSYSYMHAGGCACACACMHSGQRYQQHHCERHAWASSCVVSSHGPSACHSDRALQADPAMHQGDPADPCITRSTGACRQSYILPFHQRTSGRQCIYVR